MITINFFIFENSHYVEIYNFICKLKKIIVKFTKYSASFLWLYIFSWALFLRLHYFNFTKRLQASYIKSTKLSAISQVLLLQLLKPYNVVFNPFPATLWQTYTTSQRNENENFFGIMRNSESALHEQWQSILNIVRCTYYHTYNPFHFLLTTRTYESCR